MNARRPNPFSCFDRRWLIELIPTLITLAAAMAIAFLTPRSPERRPLVLGLTSFAVAWSIVVTIAAIRRLDELQQRIQLIAIAIAFAALGVVLAVVPFLQAIGVRWTPSPFDLTTFMMLAWAAATTILARRYR
jgi:hypothetical protein